MQIANQRGMSDSEPYLFLDWLPPVGNAFLFFGAASGAGVSLGLPGLVLVLLLVPKTLAPDVAGTLMTGLGQDTVSGTTAAAARAAGWTRPGIGKTGTTQTNQSVAFVGGVDGYAVSSLVFADGSKPGSLCPGTPVHIGNCGHGAFGGTAAAPPYFRAMNAILGSSR